MWRYVLVVFVISRDGKSTQFLTMRHNSIHIVSNLIKTIKHILKIARRVRAGNMQFCYHGQVKRNSIVADLQFVTWIDKNYDTALFNVCIVLKQIQVLNIYEQFTLEFEIVGCKTRQVYHTSSGIFVHVCANRYGPFATVARKQTTRNWCNFAIIEIPNIEHVIEMWLALKDWSIATHKIKEVLEGGAGNDEWIDKILTRGVCTVATNEFFYWLSTVGVHTTEVECKVAKVVWKNSAWWWVWSGQLLYGLTGLLVVCAEWTFAVDDCSHCGVVGRWLAEGKGCEAKECWVGCFGRGGVKLCSTFKSKRCSCQVRCRLVRCVFFVTFGCAILDVVDLCTIFFTFIVSDTNNLCT
jgi:hypothetical protein